MIKRAISAIAAAGLLAVGVATASAATDSYAGGMVMTGKPFVVQAMWGSQWNTKGDPSHEWSSLASLWQGMGTAGETWQQPMLTDFYRLVQGKPVYIQASTNVLGGGYIDVAAPSPVAPTEVQMAAEAEKAALYFKTAAGSRPVIVYVMTASGVTPQGFGTFDCSIHDMSGGSDNVAFVNYGYQTDVGALCGVGYLGQPNAMTYIALHEYAESVTDPLFDGWYVPVSGGQREIADPCTWLAAPTGGSVWNWSTLAGVIQPGIAQLADQSCRSSSAYGPAVSNPMPVVKNSTIVGGRLDGSSIDFPWRLAR